MATMVNPIYYHLVNEATVNIMYMLHPLQGKYYCLSPPPPEYTVMSHYFTKEHHSI